MAAGKKAWLIEEIQKEIEKLWGGLEKLREPGRATVRTEGFTTVERSIRVLLSKNVEPQIGNSDAVLGQRSSRKREAGRICKLEGK